MRPTTTMPPRALVIDDAAIVECAPMPYVCVGILGDLALEET
jgi:hypothetical protein